MGVFAELQLRAAAYICGQGEFLGNILRNTRAALVGEDDGLAVDLTGKTCIITGGNAGIGYATARELTKRGCKVLLACRSVEKGEAAAKALRDSANGLSAPGNVEVLPLNLSSLQSVRSLCKQFNERREPLDILILNAGIMGSDFKRRTTPDGFEEHFQVNYLSQWLLARRLVSEQLRRRRQGQPGAAETLRVVFVSSLLHMAGGLDFDDLQLERAEYSGFRGYSNSKLMNVLTARQLQSRFDRIPGCSGDAAVAVHPGLVRTQLAARWFTGTDLFHGIMHGLTAPILTFLSPAILEPPSRAARTLLFAAAAPARQVRGAYIAHGRPQRSSRAANDVQAAQKLWDVSLEAAAEGPGLLEMLPES